MSNRDQKQEDEFTKRLFFNKYKPEKKLGEGSFGKIYSAVNITNQQRYALKMVKQYYNYQIIL
jgi:serine/threonine protein kinase